MKVGDLVQIVKTSKLEMGVLIERYILHAEYRFDVLLESGKIAKGLPITYIKVINESR